MSSSRQPFSASDLDRIRAATFVRRVELHNQLGSTNDLALQRAARDTLETPWLVLAERQTRGRGRGSNRWWSAEGSLTFSLVLDTSPSGQAPGPRPQVALAAGLAVCLAIDRQLPDHRPALKWPNDVYLQGRKVCGILIEVPHGKRSRMVIGVGVNVNNSFARAPVEQRRIAVSMRDVTHRWQPRTEVLIELLRQLESLLGTLQSDLPRMIQRCRDYCMLQGKIVQCHSGGRQVQGRCRGMDHDGALVLETDAGVHRCVSGECSLADP